MSIICDLTVDKHNDYLQLNILYLPGSAKYAFLDIFSLAYVYSSSIQSPNTKTLELWIPVILKLESWNLTFLTPKPNGVPKPFGRQ